jgi:hypothetical protein
MTIHIRFRHLPLIIGMIALCLLTGRPASSGFLPNTETDARAAVDSVGNIYVVGTSDASWGSPVRPFQGGTDAFVAKLNASGVLQWLTFLGGTGEDTGSGIAVSGSDVYVVGTSYTAWGTSPDNPYSALNDAFVARLNASTGALQRHTFLGGAGDDYGYALALDGNGNLYLTGKSTATWGSSPQRAYSGLLDAFVAKLNSSGVLQWNTFLGGAGIDEGVGIAVDGSANVYLVGSSTAAWGANPVLAFTTGWDAFAAKLNTNGTLQWLTFLGGSGHDRGLGIAVDTGGNNVYAVGGSTATWGTPQRAYLAWWDGFAAKLNGSGAVQWNTFLGSTWSDLTTAVVLDGSGNVFVSGHGDAAWGTNPAHAYNWGYDGHVAKLDPSSGGVQMLSFIGGEGDDFSPGLAVDSGGNLIVAGVNDIVWGTPVQSYGDSPRAFALKMNAGGILEWNTFYGGDSWPLHLPLILKQS